MNTVGMSTKLKKDVYLSLYLRVLFCNEYKILVEFKNKKKDFLINLLMKHMFLKVFISL